MKIGAPERAIFRIFLDDFVTDLRQNELPAELTIWLVLNAASATSEELPSKTWRSGSLIGHSAQCVSSCSTKSLITNMEVL
jgi:hypothetical protein